MARRGDRPPVGISWIVTWPLSAAFAALVFLAAEEIRHPAVQEVAPPVAVDANWATTFPARIDALNAALRKTKLQLPPPVEEPRGSGRVRWTYRLYEVELKREQQATAEAAIEEVRGSDPSLTVTAENTADATEVRFGLDGLLVSKVRLLWREQPKLRPRVAVLIGSLGDDLRAARRVVEVDAPLVLGVRPFRPFSRQVAELGRLFHREVVVQLESGDAIASTSGGAEGSGKSAAQRLDAVFESVPDAVGVAWQGPTNGKSERALIAEIERRQLFFVGQTGKDARLPLPSRLVVPAPAAETPPDVTPAAAPPPLEAQLTTVGKRAVENGRAIAVGDPNEQLIEALQHALPEWKAAEIEVVPVSALAASDAASTALSAR